MPGAKCHSAKPNSPTMTRFQLPLLARFCLKGEMAAERQLTGVEGIVGHVFVSQQKWPAQVRDGQTQKGSLRVNDFRSSPISRSPLRSSSVPSRQHAGNGITPRRDTQRTFSTKSANSRHSRVRLSQKQKDGPRINCVVQTIFIRTCMPVLRGRLSYRSKTDRWYCGKIPPRNRPFGISAEYHCR
jgi:hypothetical protein